MGIIGSFALMNLISHIICLFIHQKASEVHNESIIFDYFVCGDDILIMSSVELKNIIIPIIQDYGFHINYEKSMFDSHFGEFLKVYVQDQYSYPLKAKSFIKCLGQNNNSILPSILHSYIFQFSENKNMKVQKDSLKLFVDKFRYLSLNLKIGLMILIVNNSNNTPQEILELLQVQNTTKVRLDGEKINFNEPNTLEVIKSLYCTDIYNIPIRDINTRIINSMLNIPSVVAELNQSISLKYYNATVVVTTDLDVNHPYHHLLLNYHQFHIGTYKLKHYFLTETNSREFQVFNYDYLAKINSSKLEIDQFPTSEETFNNFLEHLKDQFVKNYKLGKITNKEESKEVVEF